MARCSSEYLWSCQNLEVVIVNVHASLYEILTCDMYLQVSEVHLSADVVGCGSGRLPARVCLALTQAR